MIMDVIRPDTLVIKLTPAITDPEYELFSWVQFYFDCDNWQHGLCGERECVNEAVFYNSAKQILTQKNLYYNSKNRLAVESELDSIIGFVKGFPPSLMAIGKLFDEHIRPVLK